MDSIRCRRVPHGGGHLHRRSGTRLGLGESKREFRIQFRARRSNRSGAISGRYSTSKSQNMHGSWVEGAVVVTSLVFDQFNEHGVCIVRGPWFFFGFRHATVDEIWAHRIEHQEKGRREVFDPSLDNAAEKRQIFLNTSTE